MPCDGFEQEFGESVPQDPHRRLKVKFGNDSYSKSAGGVEGVDPDCFLSFHRIQPLVKIGTPYEILCLTLDGVLASRPPYPCPNSLATYE
jgi:hypothetical protein